MVLNWEYVNSTLTDTEKEIVSTYGKQLKLTNGVSMIERDSLRCYRTNFTLDAEILNKPDNFLILDMGYQTHIIKIEFYINGTLVAKTYSSEEYVRFIIPKTVLKNGENVIFAVITEGAEMGIRGKLVFDDEYISELDSMPKNIELYGGEPLPCVTDFTNTPNEITLSLSNKKQGVITAYENGVFRFNMCQNDSTRANDLCIEQLENNLERVTITAVKNDSGIEFKCGKNKVTVSFNPLLFKVFNETGDIIFNQISESLSGREINGVAISLGENEHFFGINENGHPHLDKRGSCEDIWVRHDFDRCDVYSPYYISTYGYGFYLNSSYHSIFDMGFSKTDTALLYTYNNDIDFFFIGANEPFEIVSLFTDITGKSPLPPKWAFGFWQAGFNVLTKEKAMYCVNRYNEENIPLDVLCIDPAWQENHSDLNWSEKRFPDHTDFVDFIKNKNNMHLILWTCPFATAEESEIYKRGLESGMFNVDKDGKFLRSNNWCGKASGLMDFESDATKKWFKEKLSKLLNEGADGFKLDGGDTFETPERMYNQNMESFKELHNLYPLMFAKTFHEICKKVNPNKRPVTWQRTGFTGSGKYPITWGGDQLANYHGTQCLIKGGQGAGMLGVPFWSQDVGGFSPTPTMYEEFFVRSYQWGVMAPLARAHGAKTEPWSYTEKGLKITGDFIKFRYSLIPYIYSLAYAAYKFGRPIMYPLFFFDMADKKTYSCDYQYGFGPSFMVAPIYEAAGNDEKIAARQIYLPKGQWIDFNTNEMYNGNQVIDYKAPLEILPLFVKCGSIIPFASKIDKVNKMNFGNLTVNFYPSDENTVFDFYNDDGETFKYQDGICNIIRFECIKSLCTKIKITTKNSSYDKNYFGAFKCKVYSKHPDSVTINGESVDFEYCEKCHTVIFDCNYKINTTAVIEIK